MRGFALFIGLLAFLGATAGFGRAQFSARHNGRTLAGSFGLVACGVVAITVALAA